MKKYGLIIIMLIACAGTCPAQEYVVISDPEGLKGVAPGNGIEKPVTIRVIYDNYVKSEGLAADWGYAVLIEGLDKTILFDTGAKEGVFESNMKRMGIDAAKVDILVLSHEHGDHTGGIKAIVKTKNNIPVIIPASFSQAAKSRLASWGLKPLLVKDPAKLCENLYSSGEFNGPIPEQALVLNTKKGLVVLTGCSHPGIAEMLVSIKSSFGKDVYMVFGGFHLLQTRDEEMNRIIGELKSIGVVKCGATHCTGDRQTEMIRKAFGSGFFELGAGNIITII